MSLEAMIWALKKAPCKSGQEQVVLIALADHANSDGTASYPSRNTISEYAQCSVKTVGRHTKAMEERGLIRRGDYRLVSHFPANRRPVVWDLDMTQIREDRQDNLSPESQVSPLGGTLVSTRGDNNDLQGGQNCPPGGTTVSHKPSLNHPLTVLEPREDEQAHPLARTRNTYTPEFERFWSAYPRKIGDKKKAERFFGEQAAEGGVERIIQAAEEFAAERLRIGTELRYIPYPATWLNQQRWKNVQYRPAQVSSKLDMANQLEDNVRGTVERLQLREIEGF